METVERPQVVEIGGVPVGCVSLEEAAGLVLAWGRRGQSRVVCLANVHMVMEAQAAPDLLALLRASDLNCADGMPLVWMQRALGGPAPHHVRGSDLMAGVCAAAAREGLPVGLYGGRPEVCARLAAELPLRYPGLRIAYRCSPPFRELAPEEDEAVVRDIAAAGARVLFVGLGCPRQERWMGAHRGRVPAVMLGVGAAFDMHAGTLRAAPRWAQDTGLEWAYRLAREPRRLARRYLTHNPRFVALALVQLGRARGGRRKR